MDQDELAEVIEKARDDGRITLDLSVEWLKYLPPEIGNLTGLKALRLERNDLTALGGDNVV